MNDKQKRAFKNELFEQFGRIGKGLASARRLELLDVLFQGPRTVEGLAAETEMSVANTSQHLQVLRSAGLVDVERTGTFAYYRVTEPAVYELWRTLRQVAERHLADVDRIARAFFADRRPIEPVSVSRLRELVEHDLVTVLDVRPAVEFAAGHLKGALSIPADELKNRLTEIPKDREVVAYCRGPYCVYADDAVELLLNHGFHARRMQEGFPEWKAAGLPVESSAA